MNRLRHLRLTSLGMHTSATTERAYDPAFERQHFHGNRLEPGLTTGAIHGAPKIEQLSPNRSIGFKRNLVKRQGEVIH